VEVQFDIYSSKKKLIYSISNSHTNMFTENVAIFITVIKVAVELNRPGAQSKKSHSDSIRPLNIFPR
jgi:hypothetical protein